MALTFYIRAIKGSKLKFRKFFEIISAFEVTGENLLGRPFGLPSWIGLKMTKVKLEYLIDTNMLWMIVSEIRWAICNPVFRQD